eukprot:scaffold76994_cov66-Phaeocystis_antarctica.AAC.2
MPRRTAPVRQGTDSAPVTEGLAHAAHEVVGDAVHFFARQATRPHDHLGNRKVRQPPVAAKITSVNEQRHTTSAARPPANVDSVRQLQLRARIGSAHDHPVRDRADAAFGRRLPASVVRHPCLAIILAVVPGYSHRSFSLQDHIFGAPGVPRDRAHRERALNDGPEGDHRRCGARQCQHLARGTVSRAARLG